MGCPGRCAPGLLPPAPPALPCPALASPQWGLYCEGVIRHPVCSLPKPGWGTGNTICFLFVTAAKTPLPLPPPEQH
jgi:hypothetical protein